MSQEVEIKTIKPFGPAIAKVSIPKKSNQPIFVTISFSSLNS